MNVLLLAPSYPIEEFPSPPLGLCYAAAGFQTAGCNVRILDFIVQHYSVEKLKKELDVFEPDIVGTNSVTMNHDEAVSLLKAVKDHNPAIITLMGGPHISFDYEGTLKNHPEIDMAVIGEGEKTITELVPVIHNRGKWCTINGIAYMENDHLVKTPKREFWIPCPNPRDISCPCPNTWPWDYRSVLSPAGDVPINAYSVWAVKWWDKNSAPAAFL